MLSMIIPIRFRKRRYDDDRPVYSERAVARFVEKYEIEKRGEYYGPIYIFKS